MAPEYQPSSEALIPTPIPLDANPHVQKVNSNSWGSDCSSGSWCAGADSDARDVDAFVDAHDDMLVAGLTFNASLTALTLSIPVLRFLDTYASKYALNK